MNTQTMALDVSKRAAIMPVVVIRQGDKSGTKLEVSVYDNGEALDLTGCSAALCVLLPSGDDNYIVSGTVDDSTASFTIDETYAAEQVGVTNIAYVEITEGQTICSTQSFRLVIERGARL